MNKIATPTIPSAAPSAAALLQRARAMVPVLAARAQATEDARSVLPETIADFEAAGFFRILQPAQYGGYEMTPWGGTRGVNMELMYRVCTQCVDVGGGVKKLRTRMAIRKRSIYARDLRGLRKPPAKGEVNFEADVPNSGPEE